MRIDSHQHFWIFDPVRDTWINDNMLVIRRNFMPTDLASLLKANNIDGVIAVQADQSHQETQFLLDLSTMYAMIKGIVGWVDLQSEQVEEHVQHFNKYSLIKGFRHIVEAESDPDFLMRPAFQQGLKYLTTYNYTYDLLIHPRHYAATLACVAENPKQRFVLDHMAKPSIKSGEYDEWALFIEELSAYPNVWCKISGLMTEADWVNWKLEDFTRYIAHAVACFGKGRIMFGSDWPVSLLAGSYEDGIAIVENQLTDFSSEEKDALWGGNAVKFYGINSKQ